MKPVIVVSGPSGEGAVIVASPDSNAGMTRFKSDAAALHEWLEASIPAHTYDYLVKLIERKD